MTRPKKPKATRRAVEPEPSKKHSDLMPEDRKAKLGTKHSCFSCNARFYDLNKPEPICPRCGADQRQRPKQEASGATPAPAAKRAQPRPMPLLDDDDGESVPFEEEMDLDIAEIDDAGDDIFEENEGEVEGETEEPEEP
ncbi:hypothetical protein MYXO_02486 [Myxococcaceae bacterium]|jgi:hypothetical protein|nr:hypothetical protein MYXO_02486 [Myxococcaceae bacterium]